MPDVRVTVDGQVVFARDCTDFQCEQTAAGEFTANGKFPVEPDDDTGGDLLDGVFKLDGSVFKDSSEFVLNTTAYGVITDDETPPFV